MDRHPTPGRASADSDRGNRIAELRHTRGLTQVELANLLGTTHSQISMLEAGDRRLTQDWMARLSDALGVRPGELIEAQPDVPLIRVTAMPSDTNPYGGIFGGWLMSQMALAAGSLASRHSKGKAVVVAATDLAFPGAMEVGDELSVYAELVREGTTSMTIRATAKGRERDGEREFDVASGTFTFVATTADNKKRPIKP
ncbi:helix-turn-helix domain-containing protein [Sphingomicrobium sediminis]|uniref:helix-turn-helix domain-containing protein n=1 Tax=Sphingomicrobium sediminis TaxID=2950949 RepID=UPI00244CEC07|nr:helix-turn-helix domain-containing protein [Sphingomicrobium sediminis]